LRSFHNRDASLCRPVFDPILKLLGNIAQRLAGYRIDFPIGVEESDNALGLLEWLN